MKKTLWPRHFGYLIMLLFFFACISAIIWLMVMSAQCLFTGVNSASVDMTEWECIWGLFGGTFMLSVCFKIVASFLHNKVILLDDKMIITGNLGKKKEQIIQYPDEIYYADVTYVAIIVAIADSKKKPIKKSGYSGLRPFKFLEFTMRNGDTKWLYIESYSKKQRQTILDSINSRTMLELSYDSLEQKDYTFYRNLLRRRNKKK